MRRSPLAVVFLTVLLDLVGFGIVIPLLPFYAESFDASPVEVGALMASYSLAQFALAPVWGRLSDRVGRRPVMLASIAGSVLSLSAFAFAGSFAGLVVARTVAGAMAANVATAQAYVADVTGPAERARGMGAIGAAFGVGFVLGPAIGGFFAKWGFSVPILVAAGLSAVNLLLAFAFLPESRVHGRPASRRWTLLDGGFAALASRPVVPGLLASGLVMTVSFAMLESMFALWGERALALDTSTTGYVFAYIGVVIAATQGGLVAPLVRRAGERRVLLLGLAGMAVGLALLPFATTWPRLLGVMGGLAFANGLATPTALALLSLHVGADERGGALGVAQSLSALGRVVGPVTGGLVFASAGVGAPFLLGSAGMLVAVCIAAYATRRLVRPGAEGAPPAVAPPP